MRHYLLIIFLLFFVKASAQEFTYKEKKELKGYPDYIMECKFSPFRNYFAIAIGNNTIEIYDKDWNKIFSHQGNPKSVGGFLAFSPDEKYIAYAKYKSDNDIAIIRLEDQKIIQVLNGHSFHITKLEFSHDGKFLASSSSDETICLWKWDDDQLVLSQKFKYEDDVKGVSFSYNDQYLLVGGNDAMIYLYKKESDNYTLADTLASSKY